MVGPFAGSGTFAPVTGEKNARDQLIDFAERHGWLLDIHARRNRHAWKDQWEQDPNQFVRAAHPDMGGEWHVELDYEVVGDPDTYKPQRSWDNTLRAVRIWHSTAVDEQGRVTGKQELRNYHQSNSARSRLWDITDGLSSTGKFVPLRKRAEALLRDPDTLMWLVVEIYHSDAERERARREKWAEEARKRREPLAITIPKRDWAAAANQLRRVAGDLAGADGLTDLRALIKDAEDQLDQLREALADEGN